jgi:ABC-type transporter MlaC component
VEVYDLSIDGVDLVATYRSTFDEEIGAGGIDGLLDALGRKEAELASSG